MTEKAVIKSVRYSLGQNYCFLFCLEIVKYDCTNIQRMSEPNLISDYFCCPDLLFSNKLTMTMMKKFKTISRELVDYQLKISINFGIVLIMKSWLIDF